MEIESIIPVLEPATLNRSPITVKKPIITPPNIAAVGIILLNLPITDSYLKLGMVSSLDLTLRAKSLGDVLLTTIHNLYRVGFTL